MCFLTATNENRIEPRMKKRKLRNRAGTLTQWLAILIALIEDSLLNHIQSSTST